MRQSTRDKWLPICRQYHHSPLTLKQFAAAHGLGYTSLYRYYNAFHAEITESEDQPQFLPVLVSAPQPASVSVKLKVSENLSLEFSALPQPEYLATVLRCLDRT